MNLRAQDRWILAAILIWLVAVCVSVWRSPDTGQVRRDAVDPLECQALKVWYLEYNQLYFMGMLPRDAVVEYGDARGAIAVTTKVGGVFHITLEKKYTLAAKTAHEVLLHESCHVISWSEKAEHGSRFKDCMHRIYNLGAFEDLL